jgi:hypothetical protein
MSRRVKEYIDIRDHASLDDLICRLTEVRNSLPDDAEPELRLRGDDIFGRKLSICYLRNLTQEEAECEARYAGLEPQPADGKDKDEEGWRAVA